ncbi:MAG TPA: hypothetical protein VK477_10935 [Acidobacteriota bacterium]|nr:hypothetical protein [Acidobacteriota bacterium]
MVKLSSKSRRSFLGRVRVLLSSRKTENAWLESDRRERLKLVAATFALVAAVGGGIALLVYSLVSH